VNALNLRHPRKDLAWIALAGPLTNLFVAALVAMVMRLTAGLVLAPGLGWLTFPLLGLLQVSFEINVFLALFNVLPIPPLDGGRIVAGILPGRKALAFSRIEPYGFIILIVLIFTGVVEKLIVPGFFLVRYLFFLGA
jgi:Zn-dependent protease